jgi:flavin-dependent dehydrogenase
VTRVVVIGAGPAGCVFAARMAQCGHDVTLIERLAFPRPRLGESLSAGVLPMLDLVGARAAVEDADFPRIRAVSTAWVDGESERRDPEGRGLLVDRGRFDALLLQRARALGVRVLQPAEVQEHRWLGERWHLRVACGDQTVDLEAGFLADAAGRRGFLRGHRTRQAVSTVALYAYWRGTGLPRQPRIEAAAHAWLWGVPLPDGLFNTLVFLDASTLRRERGRSLTAILHEHLDRSQLLAHTAGRDPRSGPAVPATLVAPVCAIDATPYVDDSSVTPASIKIGDAALAVDPLSSSGVQKAIQTALSGAIVANTLLRRPGAQEAAMQFYRSSVAQAAMHHAGWAAAQYARAAARQGDAFWSDRSAGATASSDPVPPDARRFAEAVELSPQLAFVDTPCIDGEFVTTKPALSHPRLEEAVAYLGGWELRPLLDDVRPGMTPLDIARTWSNRVPLRSALQIAGWMLQYGLLVRTS